MWSEKIRYSVNLSGAKLVSRLIDCVQNFPPKMWSGEGMEGKGGKRREGMEGKGREKKGGEGREEKGGEGREGGVYIMVTPIMPVGFWCNMISQIFLTKT